MKHYRGSDENTHYKMIINPNLITEVGDNYFFTVTNIYKMVCNAGFYGVIKDKDIIETVPSKGSITDYLNLLTDLYTLYPELQKEPVLYTSFESWTPVATSFKASYELNNIKEVK